MRRAAMLVAALGVAAGAATPALARPPALAAAAPVQWQRQVTSGGLGADPAGLPVVVAATFRLPPAPDGCGGILLPPRSRDIVVRIEDFGGSPLAPAVRRGPLRLGAVRPEREPGGHVVGVATSAARRHGHVVRAVVTFGAPRPGHAARAAAARLLAGV